MPLSKGHKNKMKLWRRQAEVANMMAGRRVGRMMKYQMRSINQSPAAASITLISLLNRGGIEMPSLAKFNAYVDQLNKTAQERSERIEELKEELNINTEE